MFLILSLGQGRAEHQLVNLAKGLQGLGHDVAVVTFYQGEPLEKDLSDVCIPVWALCKRSRWDMASQHGDLFVSSRRLDQLSCMDI